MKHVITTILAFFLAAVVAKAQTVRTLGYNTTNFAVSGYTNTNSLTWSNGFSWTPSARAVTLSNLGLSTAATFSNVTANEFYGQYVDSPWFYVSDPGNGGNGIQFETELTAAITRTNLGLLWVGLTNDSAANFRAALLPSYSTNAAKVLALNSNATDVVWTNYSPLPAYATNGGKVLAVASNGTNIEWVAISNTVTDAGSLTNFPAYLLRTNGSGAGLTNIFPAYATNGGKVLTVASGGTNLEWTAVSNTVTDAGTMTNFPTYLARTNSSAAAFTNWPSYLAQTNGTVSNVTGVVAISNGGTGANTIAGVRQIVLPSFNDGFAGRFLSVNATGTDVYWTNFSIITGFASTSNSVAILAHSQAYSNSIVIGEYARGGDRSVVIGDQATTWNSASDANGSYSTVVGGGAYAYETYSISIGNLAKCGSTGYYAAVAAGSVAVGYGAESQRGGISVGYGARNAYNGGTNGISIGKLAKSYEDFGIAVGYYAESQASNSVAVGKSAKTTVGGAWQLGTGTNNTANSIQFSDAGSVSKIQWGALATSTTNGHAIMRGSFTTNPPSNATNVAMWLLFTNGGGGSYKIPCYQ